MKLRQLGPQQFERVCLLLDEALDLPPAHREPWRRELATREPELSDLLTQLLDHVAAGSPGKGPETGALVADALARVETVEPPPRQGQRIGPYRVLHLLGRGGMGTVWLAERADGLFERRVALKVLHPGLAGHAMAERFARERSILAGLQHPHIARLLDAGITDDGQPYLALEHVEGTPLDAFCDARRLALSERIALMQQVTAAVQYAHQALVIHRDLKPANILVTPAGQVRLLDFGIAKLVSGEQAADETELTRQGGRAFTLDYAAPEQIGGRPMNTASDVYSLGVILYALLCGQRPYRLVRDTRGALEEAILSHEPVAPSQREITPACAAARRATPARLRKALAGELDTLVARAMKKDPAERYPTAEALQQDLQRWQRGEPLQARPDSALYRLRKFVGRHKARVAAASAAALLLAGAAAVSLGQAQRARAQSLVAEQQAQRAQAVQRFLLDIFTANSEQQPDPQQARQTTARELLDVGAAKVQAGVAALPPQVQEEVLETLGSMYAQLRLHDDAARMRWQRVQALRQAYGPADVRVARALLAYANDVSESQQRDRAPAALAQAQSVLDAAGDHASGTRGWVWLQSARLQQYLSLARMRGDADRALAHFRAHPEGWSLFHALQAAARARYLAGDFGGALALHHEALAEAERRHSGPSAWLVTPWVQVAEAQAGLLHLDAAEQGLRRALALSRQLNGAAGSGSLQTQAKLGGLLHWSGRRAEGLALLDEALATLRGEGTRADPNALAAVDRFRGAALVADGRLLEGEKHLAAEVADLRAHYPDSLPLSRTLLLHAEALTALGRYDASRAALDEAMRLWLTTSANVARPSMTNRYLLARARLFLDSGEPARALAELDGIAALDAGASDSERVDHIRTGAMRAQALLQQGAAAAALPIAQQAALAFEGLPLRQRLPLIEAEVQAQLGRALAATGNALGARVPLERALVLRREHGYASSPWLAQAQVALADNLLRLGERRSARELLARARELFATHAELGPHFTASLPGVMAQAEPGSRATRRQKT